MQQEHCTVWLIAIPLFCILVAEPTAGGIFNQEPGFRVMLTKKALDYVFGPVLKDMLTQLHLPDINDEKEVKIAGKIEYKLSEIVIQEVTIPNIVLVNENGQLIIRISDMSLSMHARWKYKQKSWPKIKDDGTVDLKAKDLTLSQIVSVRNDGSGRLVISSQDCSFDVRKISVKFHGGASWLYNLFTSFIESRIKDDLKNRICKEVTKTINSIGSEMTATLPLSIQVSDGAEVSCALIGDPVLSSSYILTYHNGEFISSEHPQEVPLTPSPLPPPTNVDPTDKMIYIWLTSYPLDTASYIYNEAEYMTYNMKHDEIPSFLLRTTNDYKSIIPQLYENYPGMDVEYGISTSIPPSLKLSSRQAALVTEMEVSLSVVEANQLQLAFSLTVSIQCIVELGLHTRPSGLFIAGEISSLQTNIINVNSQIGEIDPAPFQELLNTIATFLAIPNMNKILDMGLALPSHDGLTATNTVISVEEDYILLASDVSYTV